MNTVGIKELKNRLTHYLRLSRAGEEIIVCDRGKPIALIQRIDMARQPKSDEAILAQMAAEGTVTLPRKHAATKFKPVRIEGKTAASMVVEDRRASRY